MKKCLIIINGITCNMTNIKIISDSKEILYNCYTDNHLLVSLKEQEGYYLIITNKNIIFKEKIYVDNNTNCFVFNLYNYLNPKKIIFHLTDYYYPNLPIEKGEMILWQKQLI